MTMGPATQPLAYIPSPTIAALHLGPFPIRFYALCIIAGIVIAVVFGERRWRARGGEPNVITDIAIWAVPFGLIGGRLYNVVTDPEQYFPAGKDWVHVFYVWEGGLGIWGAIALGALGAWIGARRRGVRLPPLADAVAPGIVLAQAAGRWGNWFNNELYGDPTTKPWGLTIHCMDDSSRQAVPCSGVPGSTTVLGVFQPTFLYESIWCVIIAIAIIWADRRFRLGHGRVFALYVLLYTIGRGWIEHLRSDYAHHFLGLRLNDWTAIVVGLCALAYLIVSSRRRPGRETTEELYWPHFKPYDDLAAKRGKDDGEDVADAEVDAEADTGAEAEADPGGGESEAEPAAPESVSDEAAEDGTAHDEAAAVEADAAEPESAREEQSESTS